MPQQAHVHCTPAPDGSCSICSDEAVPGLVLRIDDRTRTAEVQFEAGAEVVALDLVAGVAEGDTVLVHMGFAISRLLPDD